MAYNVKFLKGTQASYDALTSKDLNTFYYIDSTDLYLGNTKLSNKADLDNAIINIGKNAEAIAKIKSDLGNLTQTKYDALVERMSAAEGKITTAEGKISTLETLTTGYGTRLTDVEGAASTNAENIGKLQTGLGTLVESAATKTELKATDDLAKANKAAIDVLNGSGDGSVAAQVAAGIAEVVADADADFDTLKEVADWILNDTTGAAAMQNDVAKLKTDVADHGTRLGVAEGEIDTLQSEMNAVEALADKADKASQANTAAIEVLQGSVKDNADAIADNEKAISDEVTRAQEAEGSLSDRLAIVEEMAGVGGDGNTGSIAQQIADAKDAAIEAAAGDATAKVNAMATTLRGEIGTAKTEAIDAAADAAALLYVTKTDFGSVAEKANSALQKADITTGISNGTIKVKGDEVQVAGLKSAAFAEASAFDASGSASAAESAAKTYADGLAANYDKAGDAAKAEQAAKAYVDSALTWGDM